MHISYSEYKMWKDCQFKRHLVKDLKLREPSNEFLSFGTALHSSIEQIASENPHHLQFGKIFAKHFKHESRNLKIAPFYEKSMLRQGENLLKALQFTERFKNWKVVALEKDIYEPLVEHKGEMIFFKAFIDIVLENDTEVLINDWKSAMSNWDIVKKWGVEAIEPGRYKLSETLPGDKLFFGQLALYRHFYKPEANGKVIRTRFYEMPRNNAVIVPYEVEISDAYQDALLEDLKRVAIEIVETKENWEKAINTDRKAMACKYCFFKKEYCSSEKTK